MSVDDTQFQSNRAIVFGPTSLLSSEGIKNGQSPSRYMLHCLARPKLWRTRSIRGFHWWMIWECFGHQRYRHNYMYRHTEVCMCLWNFVGNNRLPLHCCVCIIIDIVGLANFNSCSDGPRSLSFFEKLISRLIVNICLCLSSSICGCLIQQITC
jgi:hypothetical protein